MKNNVLVFDFDGTIADTFHYILNLSNQFSSEFNFKEIAPHEVEGMKDKTSQEVIKHLGVPLFKIPFIVAKAKKELEKDISEIQPVEGLKEILRQLKNFGYKMGILSSNSSENVLKFLKNHDLDFFDFIGTTSKIWSKNTSLSKLMQDEGLSPETTVYVGDETRDIEAAKKAGVKCVAVTWGYNSQKALKKHNPDYLVTKPDELFQLYGGVAA